MRRRRKSRSRSRSRRRKSRSRSHVHSRMPKLSPAHFSQVRAQLMAARDAQIIERDVEVHARRAADIRTWQAEMDRYMH